MMGCLPSVKPTFLPSVKPTACLQRVMSAHTRVCVCVENRVPGSTSQKPLKTHFDMFRLFGSQIDGTHCEKINLRQVSVAIQTKPLNTIPNNQRAFLLGIRQHVDRECVRLESRLVEYERMCELGARMSP